MKTITVIGTGTSENTITEQGREAIRNAEVIFGAERLLESFAGNAKRTFALYKAEEIRAQIETLPESNFAVLVSGDTGFYSAAADFSEGWEEEKYAIRFVPGISSLNSFFSKIRKSWQNTRLISCHGRESNIADAVRRNKTVFALTGGNVGHLMEKLAEAGYADLQVTCGSCLDMPEERIIRATAEELMNQQFPKLSVIYIENPDADPSVPAGIPDDRFIRSDVPMTKSEVRSVVMSKLRVQPSSVCYDIGAGTGSVTVEMGLAAYDGKIFSIEKKEEAVELVRKNIRQFHLGNVEVIEGIAPDALKDLAAPDIAFIGGSSGKIEEIFESVLAKNPSVRIVCDVIAVESLGRVLDAFKKNRIPFEIVQMNISRNREIAGLNLMTALNPVYIISGEK